MAFVVVESNPFVWNRASAPATMRALVASLFSSRRPRGGRRGGAVGRREARGISSVQKDEYTHILHEHTHLFKAAVDRTRIRLSQARKPDRRARRVYHGRHRRPPMTRLISTARRGD